MPLETVWKLRTMLRTVEESLTLMRSVARELQPVVSAALKALDDTQA